MSGEQQQQQQQAPAAKPPPERWCGRCADLGLTDCDRAETRPEPCKHCVVVIERRGRNTQCSDTRAPMKEPARNQLRRQSTYQQQGNPYQGLPVSNQGPQTVWDRPMQFQSSSPSAGGLPFQGPQRPYTAGAYSPGWQYAAGMTRKESNNMFAQSRKRKRDERDERKEEEERRRREEEERREKEEERKERKEEKRRREAKEDEDRQMLRQEWRQQMQMNNLMMQRLEHSQNPSYTAPNPLAASLPTPIPYLTASALNDEARAEILRLRAEAREREEAARVREAKLQQENAVMDQKLREQDEMLRARRVEEKKRLNRLQDRHGNEIRSVLSTTEQEVKQRLDNVYHFQSRMTPRDEDVEMQESRSKRRKKKHGQAQSTSSADPQPMEDVSRQEPWQDRFLRVGFPQAPGSADASANGPVLTQGPLQQPQQPQHGQGWENQFLQQQFPAPPEPQVPWQDQFLQNFAQNQGPGGATEDRSGNDDLDRYDPNEEPLDVRFLGENFGQNQGQPEDGSVTNTAGPSDSTAESGAGHDQHK